jgi:hypothetical protein
MLLVSTGAPSFWFQRPQFQAARAAQKSAPAQAPGLSNLRSKANVYCCVVGLLGAGVAGGVGFAGAGVAGLGDAGGAICVAAGGLVWFIAVLVPFWLG